MFKGFVNFFNKTKEDGDSLRQSYNPNVNIQTSKLKGKMIKDYKLQNTIAVFENPYSQLVSGLKQNSKKVSIYAIQKKSISEQYFVLYQNTIAQNSDSIYPNFLEIVQSANFIYMIFQQVSLPSNHIWSIPQLIDQITNLYQKIDVKINQNGLLVNQTKKLVYLHGYQPLKTISKFEINSKNKSILADVFCKMIFIEQKNKKQQIRNLIINNIGKQSLKQDIMKLIKFQNQQNNKNKIFSFQKNRNSPPIIESKGSKFFINNQKQSIKIPQTNNSQTFNNYLFATNKNNNRQSQNRSIQQKYSKSNQNQIQMYPDLTEDQEQIQKLLQVVKVNPSLINQANQHYAMRQSSRTRNQNKQQTKQIDNLIDNTKKSLIQIKVVKSGINSKSKFRIESNKQAEEQNQFQIYLASYLQIFKHFKKTMKSGLRYYQKGYSGIFLAYFITLIGILRRSKLVYALQFQDDIFSIGCKSTNIQKHIIKIKKDLLYEAKILTDLRQTIFRCYIPIRTMQIISPFLDDHIENINAVKLQDFCVFYMTSIMKGKTQQNIHFINFIEFMYIILNRNFQIVHFQSETPKIWNKQFFQLRKQLINSIIPGWKI